MKRSSALPQLRSRPSIQRSSNSSPTFQRCGSISRLAKKSMHRLSRFFQLNLTPVVGSSSVTSDSAVAASPIETSPSRSRSSSCFSTPKHKKSKISNIKRTISYPILRSTSSAGFCETPESPISGSNGWNDWGIRNVEGFTLTLDGDDSDPFEARYRPPRPQSLQRSISIYENERAELDASISEDEDRESSIWFIGEDIRYGSVEDDLSFRSSKPVRQAGSVLPASRFSISPFTLERLDPTDLAAWSSYTTNEMLNTEMLASFTPLSIGSLASLDISASSFNKSENDSIIPRISLPQTPPNSSVTFSHSTPPTARSRKSSSHKSRSFVAQGSKYYFTRTISPNETLASPFPFETKSFSTDDASILSFDLNQDTSFSTGVTTPTSDHGVQSSNFGKSLREWHQALKVSNPKIPIPAAEDFSSDYECSVVGVEDDDPLDSLEWNELNRDAKARLTTSTSRSLDSRDSVWPNMDHLERIGWTSLEKRTRSSI